MKKLSPKDECGLVLLREAHNTGFFFFFFLKPYLSQRWHQGKLTTGNGCFFWGQSRIWSYWGSADVVRSSILSLSIPMLTCFCCELWKEMEYSKKKTTFYSVYDKFKAQKLKPNWKQIISLSNFTLTSPVDLFSFVFLRLVDNTQPLP